MSELTQREPGLPNRPRRRAPHPLTLIVLAVGIAITATLTAISRHDFRQNEQSLLVNKAKLTAAAIDATPIDVQRRLAASAVLAAESGNTAAFTHYILGSITPLGPFTSVRLMDLAGPGMSVKVALGQPTLMTIPSPRMTIFVEQAVDSSKLEVTRLVEANAQRLGYALSFTGGAGTYVVYAEQMLPADRRFELPANSGVSDLTYALYWGRTKSDEALVATNSTLLPLQNPTASAPIPFGNTSLTLVVAPRGSLIGLSSVAWGIALAGGLFTLLVAAMTEWLVRRREFAAVLAAENRRLYQSQRNLAESLQHSLLPQELPEREEFQVAARYLAGITGTSVGGDWYDAVEVGPGRLAFVIGDVAGQGFEAARLMASLRFTFRAYATEGNGPAEILDKLGRLLDVRTEDRFATVLCGVAEMATGEVTIANAGHLAPLLVEDDRPRFLTTKLGPPIGVGDTPYASVSFTMPPGAMLLTFTDGLVERRDESLSEGLDRIVRATARAPSELEELLDEVCASLVPAGSVDDIAVLALRRSATA